MSKHSKQTARKAIGKGEAYAPCPFCAGNETELYALFGGTLSTSQYYCNGCRVVFERLKWSKNNREE